MMSDISNTFNTKVDQLSHFILDNAAESVKKGLNFNNIFSDLASPTGRLVDYNIRILVHNLATVGIIYELALATLDIAIWGIKECPVAIAAHIIFAGLYFVARQQMQKELNGFWSERAATVVADIGVKAVNGIAKLANRFMGKEHTDIIPKGITLSAGQNCGPMGMFKTVAPMSEVISKVKGEAHIDGDSDQDFEIRMTNLPISTLTFSTLLGINAALQGDALVKLAATEAAKK